MARRASAETVMPVAAPDGAAACFTDGTRPRGVVAFSPAGGAVSAVRADPVVRRVAMNTPVVILRFERAESLQAARLPCKPGPKRDRAVCSAPPEPRPYGPGAARRPNTLQASLSARVSAVRRTDRRKPRHPP